MTTEENEVIIANRYQVLDTLGQGGMATVYLAHDQQLDRTVAVKMLLVRDLTDGLAVRFHNEAKAIGRLKHSAIMTALDFGVTEDGKPYLVLEHKEGTTLDTILKARGKLEIGEALFTASRICAGLSYAHEAGVLHRDIKPSNIYVTGSELNDDAVKILDFGIAKFQTSDGFDPEDDSQHHTRAGTVIGSPAYMSPEQARGERVDERADVYSLGCVLFEMLTGTPPILGENAVDTLSRKSKEQAPQLRDRAPERKFSASLESIVAKCLALEKEKRYQKAADVMKDLDAQLSESAEHGHHDIRTGLEAREAKAGVGRGLPKLKGSPVLFVTVLLLVLVGSTIAYVIFASRPAAEDKPEKPTRSLRKMFNTELPLVEEVAAEFSVDSRSCSLRRTADDAAIQRAVNVIKGGKVRRLVLEDLKNFDGRKLRYFKDLGLEALSVKYMTLDDAALESINEMSSLIELKMDGSKWSSTLFRNPEKLSKLVNLSLIGDSLTREDLEAIAKLPALQAVALHYSDGVTPEFLKAVSKIPLFDGLQIGGKNFTNEHIAVLPELDLSTLIVHELKQVPIDFLMQNIGKMSRLKKLNLNDLSVNSGSFRYLEPLDRLGYIRLNRISGLDVYGIRSLSKLKNLSMISLVSIQNFRDTDLHPLLQCKSLHDLKLTLIPSLSDSTYRAFTARNVKVEWDRGRGTSGLSIDVAEKPGQQASSSADTSESDSGSGLSDLGPAFHSGASTNFNKEGACELSGNFTEGDIKALVEDVKNNHPTNKGFSMSRVDEFNGEWLKYLIPLKPMQFKASGVELDDSALRQIGQMKSLNFLGLDQSLFPVGSMHYLSTLPKLTHLNVSGDIINDEDIVAVASMKNLVKLNMKAVSGFSPKSLEKFKKLSHLSQIEIGGAPLLPAHVKFLQGTKVRNAELAGRLQVKTSDILREMVAWPALERLIISSVDLRVEDLEVLAKFPALKSLKLANLSIVGSRANFMNELAGVDKLDGLTLSAVTDLNDADVLKLRRMKNLKQLIIIDGDDVSDGVLYQLEKTMTNTIVGRSETN